MNDLSEILRELNIAQAAHEWSKAADICRRALLLVDANGSPVLWSRLQHALGSCLLELRDDDSGLAVDEAIKAFQEALRFRTIEKSPVEWVNTIHNLGRAHHRRQGGDRAHDLETAISCYSQELRALSPDAAPAEWCETMSFLGDAYFERQTGDKNENLQNAITCYLNALKIARLEPARMAETAHDLAVTLVQWEGGDKLENLGIAVKYYQTALSLWKHLNIEDEICLTQKALGAAHLKLFGHTRSTEALQAAISSFQEALGLNACKNNADIKYLLASAENTLGQEYIDSHEKNRQNNLEKAIEAYTEALKHWPEKSIEWANTQNSIGIAYDLLTLGNQADNIEKAIESYGRALEVRTRQETPVDWAHTQYNLALSYCHRIRGNRSENLEHALSALQVAAEVYESEGLSDEWSDAQNQIGVVYAERIEGDWAENLERKISAHQNSLTAPSRTRPSKKWAAAMHNLAIAYRNRGVGLPPMNVEASISYCMAALSATSPETDPIEWAETMTVLGNALLKRKNEKYQENVEDGIVMLMQSTQKFDELGDKTRWAAAMVDLASAYSDRPQGEKAQNLLKAVDAYDKASSVITPDSNPIAWSSLKHNQGGALAALAKESKGSPDHDIYFNKAVKALQESLSVTTDVMPRHYVGTQYRLGNLYFDEQQWSKALVAYGAAMDAGEAVYLTSATREAQNVELQRIGFMPVRTAYSLAKTGKFEQAVEVVEHGLARSLKRNLALELADLRLATPGDRNAFIKARQEIKQLEVEARAPSQPASRSFETISVTLREARRRLEGIVTRIRDYVPEFLPMKHGFKQISDIASELDHALIYLFASPHGCLALIVGPHSKTLSEQDAVWLDNLRTDQFEALLSDDGQGWLGYLHCVADAGLEQGFDHLSQILDSLLPTLERDVMNPIVQRLAVRRQEKAVLIMANPFGILPTFALAGDKNISMAPCAYCLHHTWQAHKERVTRASVFLGVGNPLPSNRPLRFAYLETVQLARFFDADTRKLFLDEDATAENVKSGMPRATHLHLACHGGFNVVSPLESTLYLSGSDKLTLRDVLDGSIDLSALKLVVMSACQTGIIDFLNAPDEFVGFPAAFLEAQVPSAIGTLWSIDDQATALLMIKFYENLIVHKLPSALALHRAQTWLREATGLELASLSYLCLSQLPEDKVKEFADFRAWADSMMAPKFQNAMPFSHPVHWAAFYHAGMSCMH